MAVWLMPDRRRIRALRLSEAVARSIMATNTSRGRASQSRREKVILGGEDGTDKAMGPRRALGKIKRRIAPLK